MKDLGRILSSVSFVIAAISAASVDTAFAAEGAIVGSRYRSARASGMGDAYLGVTEDGLGGLFYNPSVIGAIKGMHFEPIGFALMGNDHFFGSMGLDSINAFSLSAYAPTLARNANTYFSSGFQLSSAFATRGFAFGILARSEVDGQSFSNGNLLYRSNYLLVPTAGYGLSLGEGVLRLGYVLQWVNQAMGERTVAANSTPLSYREGIPQGSGLSHNFGATLTFPVAFLPQFDFVARNVLGLNFGTFTLFPVAQNSPGAPARQPMTMDLAFTIHPKLGNGGTVHWGIVWNDFAGESGTPLLSRINTGLEFDFRNSFFLRLGLAYGGYPSAGIGFERKNAEFHLSYYTLELGQAFRSNRDARFMMQYQVRAF